MTDELRKKIIELQKVFIKQCKKQEVGQTDNGKPIYEESDIYTQRVATDLLDALEANGAFYLDSGIYYYFDNIENKLRQVGNSLTVTNDFVNYLNIFFNFGTVSTNRKDIYAKLYSLITWNPEKATTHIFNYYNPKANTLYIRASNTEVIKVTSDEVKYVANGTDGVIFRTNEWMGDIKVDTESIQDNPDYLDSLFFNDIWFSPTLNLDYDNLRQTLIFRRWFFSLFFGTIIKRKPILVMQGETGTGKTSTLLNVGRILYGENFRVSMLQDDKRDFVSGLVNSHLVVMDNVDEKPPAWFLDTITSMTTGGAISYRPLYKDVSAPSINVQCSAWIAVTTRTALFNRADLANRSIINTLEKRDNIKFDPVKYEESMIQKRNSVWLHVLGELRTILTRLPLTDEVPINIRINEFAKFCIGISESLEEKQFYIETLSILVKNQDEFSAQNHPLINALRAFADNKIVPVTLSQTQLKDILNDEFTQEIKSNKHMGNLIDPLSDALKPVIHYRKKLVDGYVQYEIGKKLDFIKDDE